MQEKVSTISRPRPRCNIVMLNSDPHDGFFYPQLIPILIVSSLVGRFDVAYADVEKMPCTNCVLLCRGLLTTATARHRTGVEKPSVTRCNFLCRRTSKSMQCLLIHINQLINYNIFY